MEIKGTSKVSFNRGVPTPGVYVIEHGATGKKYVGSAANLYQRKNSHLSSLKHGTHKNQLLQEVYDQDPKIEFTFFPTESREFAYEKEQELLDQLKGKSVLLNISPDARTPAKNRPDSLRHWENRVASHRSVAKAVAVDGVRYESMGDAARALNLNSGTVYKRVASPSHPRWHYAPRESLNGN